MKAANRKMSVNKWRRIIETMFAYGYWDEPSADAEFSCGFCKEYATHMAYDMGFSGCDNCPLFNTIYIGKRICGNFSSWYSADTENLDAALIIWEAVQTL